MASSLWNGSRVLRQLSSIQTGCFNFGESLNTKAIYLCLRAQYQAERDKTVADALYGFAPARKFSNDHYITI